MAQVPFSGVPSVAPGGELTPRYVADAKPEAFGVNVWQAVQHLGNTASKVGDEVFARGIAMQDLANHSEAQEADVKFMQAAGDIHEKLKSLQGKEAVDYYTNGFKDDLQKARSGIRDGLSNDMSQKLFDSQSLSTLGRTIFNGAGLAGEQNRNYAVSTSKAKINALKDATLSNPRDEDAFQDHLQDTEDEIRSSGPLQGQSPEVVDQAVAVAKSDLWSQRIKGLAKEQPIQAGKMLEQAIKDGEVRGEDIGKLTNIVQQARNTTGARVVSNQVATGAGHRWGAGQVDIKQAGEAIGQIESGGNYNTIGVQTSHGSALGKYQVMEEFLPEFLSKAGLPPMSGAEFLKDHAAQDQVFAVNFGAYMKQTGSANDAASMWLTGKPLAEAGNRKDALGTNALTYVSRFNAALARSASLSAKVDMGQSIAREQAPEDPLFPDFVRDRVESDHNRQLAIKRDDEFQNRQVIETALMGQEGGRLPSTVEELTADPKAADAWEKLLPSNQRRYMNVLARNAKGDHNWTDETLRQYQQFKGQAQADPAEFLDTNVIDTNLPNSAKRELINLQQRLKGKAEGDPRVARALAILAPDMQAAGIDKKNKDDYYQFTGALADQLQQFADENKRGPKTDEVKLIGSRLMQAHKSPGMFGMFFGGTSNPTFQVPVPQEEADKIKLDPAWTKLGITPTDQQIQRIYTRKLYQDLYGGTAKSASAPVPNAPISQ